MVLRKSTYSSKRRVYSGQCYKKRCKAIPNNTTDYLDIYEDNITVEKLIQFRKEAHIGQWYCSNPSTKDKNKMLHIPVAEQIDKPIECKRYE